MKSAHRPLAPDVPLAVWRELLDAAIVLREQRPWEWMSDSEIFALVDEADRAWFPSVLGAGGQVFGLALYRGEVGLRYLLQAREPFAVDHSEALFGQDALLLDWGTKKALAPEDLSVLAALGYAPRPRTRQAWPSFRSHAPGWHPWFLTEGEARALARCARGVVAAAELVRDNPGFFTPNDRDPHVLPTLDLETALDGPLTPEHVEWRTWGAGAIPTPPAVMPPAHWASFRALPRVAGAALEFDIFHLFSPTSDGGRPYFPRVALIADGETGYIYAMEMAGPMRAWEDLVVAVWDKALGSLRQRPGVIAIRRSEWESSLAPLAAALGLELELCDELPFIAEARDSLSRFRG